MIACPRGWHLPVDAEWDLLAQSMNGTKTQNSYWGLGDKMKLHSGGIFLRVDNPISINWGASAVENGFNALPCGGFNRNLYPGKDPLADGRPHSFAGGISMWSATTYDGSEYPASYRSVSYHESRLQHIGGVFGSAISVRCVKD